MSEQLKPCPFCGGRETSVCERDNLHFVMCDNCTAEGPAMEGVQSRLDAAKEWNRRTPSPASTAGGERGSIEDDEDFWALVTAWANSRGTVRDHLAKRALIAHIDTWTARSAGDAVELLREVDAALTIAWGARELPASVISGDLVRRYRRLLSGTAPAPGNTAQPKKDAA